AVRATHVRSREVQLLADKIDEHRARLEQALVAPAVDRHPHGHLFNGHGPFSWRVLRAPRAPPAPAGCVAGTARWHACRPPARRLRRSAARLPPDYLHE